MKGQNIRLSNSIYYNADIEILARASILRKNMTPAELLLWRHIRKEQLGVRFRRQHAIYKFIVDFYCHSKKLAIEIDGGYHLTADQMEKDKNRSDELNNLGISVLRFSNERLELDIENVLMEIGMHIGII